MSRQALHYLLLAIFFISIAGCKKKKLFVPDNEAPYYNEIPTVLIENYVNRLYIDLVGREPLDTEMEADVQFLRDSVLSEGARIELVQKLQYSTDFVAGDTSYNHAYYHRMYELGKARLLEGASNKDFLEEMGNLAQSASVDSINGDSVRMEMKKKRIERMQKVLDSETEYRLGEIEIDEVYARMLNNDVYDVINMNTFNFINASFDDLFFRFPTQEEFFAAFDMIEYNQSRTVFEQPGQNKNDYIQILVGSREFYEGLIRWSYIALLQREPETLEIQTHMETFYTDHDLQKVQEAIMVTDEYAHFGEEE